MRSLVSVPSPPRAHKFRFCRGFAFSTSSRRGDGRSRAASAATGLIPSPESLIPRRAVCPLSAKPGLVGAGGDHNKPGEVRPLSLHKYRCPGRHHINRFPLDGAEEPPRSCQTAQVHPKLRLIPAQVGWDLPDQQVQPSVAKEPGSDPLAPRPVASRTPPVMGAPPRCRSRRWFSL